MAVTARVTVFCNVTQCGLIVAIHVTIFTSVSEELAVCFFGVEVDVKEARIRLIAYSCKIIHFRVIAMRASSLAWY
jgi:hypothetical protein